MSRHFTPSWFSLNKPICSLEWLAKTLFKYGFHFTDIIVLIVEMFYCTVSTILPSVANSLKLYFARYQSIAMFPLHLFSSNYPFRAIRDHDKTLVWLRVKIMRHGCKKSRDTLPLMQNQNCMQYYVKFCKISKTLQVDMFHTRYLNNWISPPKYHSGYLNNWISPSHYIILDI